MSDMNPNTENQTQATVKKINEQVEVVGNQLVDRVKELIEEGNVRRLIIRNPEGRTMLEVPLTIGVAVGGAFAVFAPIWAALGALAALVTKVTIEVVREEPAATGQDIAQMADDVKDRLSGGPGAGM
jgi:hypothetical protein